MALLQLLNHINDLKQLPRTGWLLAGVSAPESIAEHALGVTFVAWLLAEEINRDLTGNGLRTPLQLEQVLKISLLHDLGESLLTDLPRVSAQLLGPGIKQQAEAAALGQILADQPEGAAWLALWTDYDQAGSPEARLVKDADKLEMIHQALRYELHGNRGLQGFWQGAIWHYPVSRQLYDTLCLARPGRTEPENSPR